jgi:hypothetical protein
MSQEAAATHPSIFAHTVFETKKLKVAGLCRFS